MAQAVVNPPVCRYEGSNIYALQPLISGTVGSSPPPSGGGFGPSKETIHSRCKGAPNLIVQLPVRDKISTCRYGLNLFALQPLNLDGQGSSPVLSGGGFGFPRKTIDRRSKNARNLIVCVDVA